MATGDEAVVERMEELAQDMENCDEYEMPPELMQRLLALMVRDFSQIIRNNVRVPAPIVARVVSSLELLGLDHRRGTPMEPPQGEVEEKFP